PQNRGMRAEFLVETNPELTRAYAEFSRSWLFLLERYEKTTMATKRVQKPTKASRHPSLVSRHFCMISWWGGVGWMDSDVRLVQVVRSAALATIPRGVLAFYARGSG